MENKKELNFINLYNENGEKHGYWEDYYDNGQLSFKGDYVNGVEHGLWEYYFDNGELWYKGNWVNGQPHGYWEYYYSDGELKYKGYYDMGKRVDRNPEEPKIVELTLTEIAARFNIPIEQLRIKK